MDSSPTVVTGVAAPLRKPSRSAASSPTPGCTAGGEVADGGEVAEPPVPPPGTTRVHRLELGAPPAATLRW